MTAKLVPRLNSKYSLGDAIFSLKSLFEKSADHSVLVKLFDTENICFYNHARTGMRIALSSLKLAPGSGVGLMTFNCLTVLNSINKAGLKPIFIDVTDDLKIDLNDLEKKKGKICALIVNHMFGIPNHINKIKEICPDIPIIEDCAHSFMTQYSHNNKLTGSDGDFAIFSYGRGKFPSISDGGFVVVNNNLYKDQFVVYSNNLKKPTLFDELKNIARSYFLSVLHNPYIYKYITLPLLKETDNKKDIVGKYNEYESKEYKSNKALFIRKIRRVKIILEKQKYFGYQITNLIPNSHLIFSKDYNYFMIPIVLDNRDRFINHFNNKGIGIGSHFSASIEWAYKHGYDANSCKNSERIARNIVTIPCHYGLNTKIVNKIKKLLIHYFNESDNSKD